MPGWVHQEVADHLEAFMEAVDRKLSPRLMIFLPPRTGKTQLVSRAFPAYLLGHKPAWEIISATYGQELADDIGRYVRSILNDPIYHTLFPDTKVSSGSNAADRIDTTARGGYRAVGRGGSLTGRGAHVLILDDPLKDNSEADSSLVQENLRSWYLTSARSRLAPGGGVIIVQTLWSLNDLPLFLLENEKASEDADKWCVYKYPAIAVEDETFRKKGEALHPERFSVKELLKTRASFYAGGHSRYWNSLYQQNPVEEEGNFFKADWFKTTYDKLPDGPLSWYIGVDFAVSKANTADRTAIVRFALDKDQNIYVDKEIFWDRVSSLDAINAVLRMAKGKNVFQIGTEKGVIDNAIGPLWEQRCKEERYFPFLSKLSRSLGKHVYAESLRGRMQQGKIFWPKSHFIDDTLKPEFLAFRPDADNKQDNLVDALTNGLLMLGDMLAPRDTTAKAASEDDIVPGSYEDLEGRRNILQSHLTKRRDPSLHAWHRKKTKKAKFW